MTIVSIPSATTTIAGIAGYSVDIFTEFLPLIWIPLGFFAVACILLFLTKTGRSFLAKVTGIGRRRRGR